MDRVATLRKRFEADRRRLPLQPLPVIDLPVIDEEGLRLGRGTRLARIAVTRSGESGLAVEADRSRILALLTPVHGRPAHPCVLKHIERASMQWRRGDKAMAHIELAFPASPAPPSEEDAFRLFLAEELLAQELTPDHLVQELGFAPAFLKYDPDQPRVPSGNGRESGRWTSEGRGGGEGTSGNNGRNRGGGSSAFLGPVASAATPIAARSFLGEISPSLVRALAAFAAGFSTPVAVFGALFIPTPSGGVTEGTLPDAPNVRFRLDRAAGACDSGRKQPMVRTLSSQRKTAAEFTSMSTPARRLAGTSMGKGESLHAPYLNSS